MSLKSTHFFRSLFHGFHFNNKKQTNKHSIDIQTPWLLQKLPRPPLTLLQGYVSALQPPTRARSAAPATAAAAPRLPCLRLRASHVTAPTANRRQRRLTCRC